MGGSGLRLRLMFKRRNSTRLSAAAACDQEECADKDEAPYFCCKEDAGLAEKFCLSPVNPKLVDISYPENNDNGGGGRERETGFKRHLGKATVVSMGCGCRDLAKSGRRRRSSSSRKNKQVEEEEKKRVMDDDKENADKESNMNNYRWEEEDGWHVIAKVNDEIVKKKVVLRRKSDQKCPPASPAPSPESAITVRSACFARKNNSVQKKNKKIKKKSAGKPQLSCNNKLTDATAGGGCCNNYRLSTSSADTAGLDASSFSWEKDYGSFASDGEDYDEDETLFSASDYCKSLSFSSESSFEFYESRSPHLSTIHESPRRNFRRRPKAKSRLSLSGLSPANFSAGADAFASPANAEKLPLLSSPDSAKFVLHSPTSAKFVVSSPDLSNFEAKDGNETGGGFSASAGQSLACSRASSEAEEADLEANAKIWREAGFPLRRDDIRTVIYKSSELRYNPNCLPFSMVSCGRDVNGRKKKSAKTRSPPKKKGSVNSSKASANSSYSRISDNNNKIYSNNGGSVSERKRSPRSKANKSLPTSASRVETLPPPSNVQGTKVGESVAVVKSSQDPYRDFRTSMLEMIVEKQIFQPNDLEQLLQCFLSLNSQQHHEIIVQVFTEIWGNIFNGTKNPSTPVAFFHNNVV